MATIKSFTTLEQSRRLAEILPIESADMYWDLLSKDKYAKVNNIGHCLGRTCVYAWSLAALMEIIRTKSFNRQSGFFMGKTEPYCVFCGSECQTKVHNEPVDACYEMILKLNELNLL